MGINPFRRVRTRQVANIYLKRNSRTGNNAEIPANGYAFDDVKNDGYAINNSKTNMYSWTD